MIGLLVIFELVLTLLVFVVGWEVSRRPRYRWPRGQCQGCGYRLEGLPAESVCPECGRADPGAPEWVQMYGVNSRVSRRLGGVLVLTFFAALCMAALVRVAYRWSYALQLGAYRSDVIERAISVRKFDMPFEDSLLPLFVATGVCTLMTLMGDRFPFRRRAVQILGVGWGLSMLWLIVGTYLRYG